MINAKGSSAPASDLRSLDCGCRRGLNRSGFAGGDFV
jgi:hypothetical protein